MKNLKDALLLYAVTDRRWLRGKTLPEAVEEAIVGGATIVQLREKEAAHDEFLRLAKDVLAVCRRHGVPLIINDDVEIALECGADGVHVGQEDMELTRARAMLGADSIIGVSAHDAEEARRAFENGADYLGSGAVFPTGTKDVKSCIGPDGLARVAASVGIPVVAIGGITADNMSALAGTGAAGAAVVSAIFAADGIEAAARDLRFIAERTFA